MLNCVSWPFRLHRQRTFVFGQNVIFISFSCHHRSQIVPIPLRRIRASVQTSKKSTSPAELVPAWTTNDCLRIWRDPRGFRSTELCFRVSQLSYYGPKNESLIMSWIMMTVYGGFFGPNLRVFEFLYLVEVQYETFRAFFELYVSLFEDSHPSLS